MPSPAHLLTGAELDASRLQLLLHRAAALKGKPHASRALEGRTVALREALGSLEGRPPSRTRTPCTPTSGCR